MTSAHDTASRFQAMSGSYETADGGYVAHDTVGHGGLVAVSFTGPEQRVLLPAAVAWEVAEQLDAAGSQARKARLGHVGFALPGQPPVHLEITAAAMLAQQIRVAARLSGAEGLESTQERRQRLATARARAKLGPFDPALGDPASVALDCLSDEWQLFSQLRPRRPLTAKTLRSALGALRRAGLITSRRNQIYGLVEYATTAEGEQWRYGGDVEDHITTPAMEPGIDRAAHKRDRLAREHALAAQDAALQAESAAADTPTS